jgi:type II secretory pathway pseudopilin PulG
MKKFWIWDLGFWIGQGCGRNSTGANFETQEGRQALLARRLKIQQEIQNPRSAIQNSSGFSLVEVTLAIGIVSFALLAVVALLPVGLKSVKSATEHAGAAEVMRSLAGELRSASSSDGTNFSGNFAGGNISYTIGTTNEKLTYWTNLTLEGTAESDFNVRRLSAVLRVNAPANAWSPGRATISVAWSAQANPEWNPTTGQWLRADGSLTSGLQFLPRP